MQSELRRSGFEDLIPAGIVITGGSSTMEGGVVELAEEIFHMPVRLACPQAVSGMTEVVNNPIYATGVGLLIHASGKWILAGRRCSRGGRRLPRWLSA